MPMHRTAVPCAFAAPVSGRVVGHRGPGARSGHVRSGRRRPGAFRFEN